MSRRTGPEKLLVIGVGNDFRRDDAAGLSAVRRIRSLFNGIECLELSGEWTDLIESWQGRETVFLVDAASGNHPPGTVLRIEAGQQPLETETFRLSSHSLGVDQAVELSRAMGDLPGDFLIFGIIGRDFGFGEGLSSEAEEGVRESVRQLAQEIEARMANTG